MQPDLEDLKITQNELEHLTGLDISDAFMGRAMRSSIFRQPKRFTSFLVSEFLTLGLLLIFCLPIGLILARSFDPTSRSVGVFLVVMLGVAIALFLLWNFYIWQQGKQMKTLAHLLDEVDRHNEIIKALDIIDELGSVKNSTINLNNRDAVLEALRATRESLVCALMTEKVLRKHQKFIARRYELFANIETNLSTLQTLQVNNQAHEYGQLLNEALHIGMSVHHEMEKFER